MQSYNVTCLSEALSPITHASGHAGNEAIVAREPVWTARGVVSVPFLSGNAIRHRFVREPGVMWLIDRYGLRGKLTLQQLNFLMHGGNLTESTAHENTRRIAEMHRTWPLLRLLGGALPNQILCGALDAWRGTLVCEENRQSLAHALPCLPEARMMSAERFASGYQYTRGDAGKRGIHAQPLIEPAEGTASNLMIYSGQAVMRGAMFAHGFTIRHASEVELGALLWSLLLWQHGGGTIGGNARLGHGRLKLTLVNVDRQRECVDAYLDHVAAHEQAARNWLYDAFAGVAEPKAKKSAKTAKKGGKGDDAQPEKLEGNGLFGEPA
jgi:hypothetical protein